METGKKKINGEDILAENQDMRGQETASNSSWFKLHREILEKPIWLLSTPVQKVVFITLLATVNWASKQWEWRGKRYECKPGECITSLNHLAEACGVGVSKQMVRTALKRFKDYEFLDWESSHEGLKITILNWAKYQQLPDGEDDKKTKETGTKKQRNKSKGKKTGANTPFDKAETLEAHSSDNRVNGGEHTPNTEANTPLTRVEPLEIEGSSNQENGEQHASNTPLTRLQHASNTPLTPILEDIERVERVEGIEGVEEVESVEAGIKEKEKEKETKTARAGKEFRQEVRDMTEKVITRLNEVCGTRYKHTAERTRGFIQARMNAGATYEDFCHVIEVKADEWLGSERMEKFLRPETLFGSKFENYLNQRKIPKSTGNPFLDLYNSVNWDEVEEDEE